MLGKRTAIEKAVANPTPWNLSSSNTKMLQNVDKCMSMTHEWNCVIRTHDTAAKLVGLKEQNDCTIQLLEYRSHNQ